MEPAVPEDTADDVDDHDGTGGTVPEVDATTDDPLDDTMDEVPVPLLGAGPPRHAWADRDELTVSVTGASDRLYYLLATGRSREAVAHWRQGPYAILDETTTLPVELPNELQVAILGDGWGHLAVRVAATTLDDVPYPQEVVGQTVLGVQGGAIVGLAREEEDAVSATRALSGVEDAVWATPGEVY